MIEFLFYVKFLLIFFTRTVLVLKYLYWSCFNCNIINIYINIFKELISKYELILLKRFSFHVFQDILFCSECFGKECKRNELQICTTGIGKVLFHWLLHRKFFNDYKNTFLMNKFFSYFSRTENIAMNDFNTRLPMTLGLFHMHK